MRSVFFWYILFWNTITKIIKESPQDLQDLGSHSCLATDTWYDCCFIGSGKISATMPHKSAKDRYISCCKAFRCCRARGHTQLTTDSVGQLENISANRNAKKTNKKTKPRNPNLWLCSGISLSLSETPVTS